jgi:tRNA pseudouridine55 synthase
VLAADLGIALGGGAHVRRLRRTAVGPWTEEQAVGLEVLSAGDVILPAAALPWLDPVIVDGHQAGLVANGRPFTRDTLQVRGAGPWRLIGPDGDLLAVYVERESDRRMVKPAVVLVPG